MHPDKPRSSRELFHCSPSRQPEGRVPGELESCLFIDSRPSSPELEPLPEEEEEGLFVSSPFVPPHSLRTAVEPVQRFHELASVLSLAGLLIPDLDLDSHTDLCESSGPFSVPRTDSCRVDHDHRHEELPTPNAAAMEDRPPLPLLSLPSVDTVPGPSPLMAAEEDCSLIA